MSTPTNKLVVFIGRFQMPHNAHVDILHKALEHGEKVLLLIGGANRSRAPKNPLTFVERKMLWESILTAEEKSRVIIEPLNDHRYDDAAWVQEVQSVVYKYVDNKAPVALIGHSKDASSYYLKMFPQWTNIEVKNLRKSLNATDIRNALYQMDPEDDGEGFAIAMHEVCPPAVLSFMRAFRRLAAFKDLREEYLYNEQYKKDTRYVGVPYDPSFMAVDAVVTCQNHVLLVRRKKAPGKGLWALPGGHVGKRERTVDAMLRELNEETGIDIAKQILRSNIQEARLFDDPERAERGRVYSYAYYIDLPHTNLPKLTVTEQVSATEENDVVEAAWFPISYVHEKMKGELFEDHDEIYRYFVKK